MKRLFDLAVAVSLLTLLSAPLLLLALLVRVSLGGPVLFRQVRPGLHGRPFRMIKFRTMTDGRAADGSLLPDAERLTPFGRFLRASSLDELPELWNILRGDMSFVGPRPLLPRYLPYYTKREAMRHRVRPGLTGLAQVHGRNALTWDARLEYDARYVEQQTLWLDLQILARTVMLVLRRHGVSAEGQATMQPLDEYRRKESA